MFFEDAVQVNAIEHHRRSQPGSLEMRPEMLFERSALDTQVGDRLLAVVATLAHREIVVLQSITGQRPKRKESRPTMSECRWAFPTAAAECVRERRRTSATVENAQVPHRRHRVIHAAWPGG
jgi:hypothetical protein